MNTSNARNWQQTYISNAQPKEKKVVRVRKQGWITKGEKILYSLVGICLIVASIFMVSYASSTDTVNRKLQSLEKTVQQQEVTNEGLLFEMKELSRPERITRIARENGYKIQDAEVKQAQAFND